MGHSHYWRSKPHRCLKASQFKILSQQVKKIIERAKLPDYNIKIDVYDLTPKLISFNGWEPDEEDHETFFLDYNEENTDFQFCKTAHKPYDTVVTATLIAAHLMSSGQIKISSDGNAKDWLKGFILLSQACPEALTGQEIILGDKRLTFGLSDDVMQIVKHLLTATPTTVPTNTSVKILAIGGLMRLGTSSILKLLEQQQIPLFSTAKVLSDLIKTISTLETLRWSSTTADRDSFIATAHQILIPLFGQHMFRKQAYQQAIATGQPIVAIETLDSTEYDFLEGLTTAANIKGSNQTLLQINSSRDIESAGISLFALKLN